MSLEKSKLEQKAIRAVGSFAIKLGYLSQNAYEQFCALYDLEEKDWPQAKVVFRDLLSLQELNNLESLRQEWLFLDLARNWKFIDKSQMQRAIDQKLKKIEEGEETTRLLFLTDTPLEKEKLQKIEEFLHKHKLISINQAMEEQKSLSSISKKVSSSKRNISPSKKSAISNASSLSKRNPIPSEPPSFSVSKNEGSPRVSLARYKVIQEIGYGGTGKVYKAYDKELQRSVALKVLKDVKERPDHLKRFFREAYLMAKLDHRNIVSIYDIGEEKGTLFYTMELIDGFSLNKHIETKQLSFLESAQILKKVSNAVTFAHANGVIHRDIKPSNIMIDQNGEPRLLDFGLAKSVEGNEKISQTGVIVGTPVYMSPEQATGSHLVNEMTDIYSMGALFYEMITGEPPFKGNSSLNVILQVLHVDPLRPRKISSSIPIELESICLKAMDKKTSRRYPSSRALGDDLHRFINGLPVEAVPPSFLYTLGRTIQKHKKISLFICFLLAIFSTNFISRYYSEYKLLTDLQKCTKLILSIQQIASHSSFLKHQESLKFYVNEFQKYIDKNSKNSAAYLGSAVCHMLARDYPKAIYDLGKTIELEEYSPFSPDMLYLLRGQCLMELAQYEKAQSDLQSVSNSGKWFWISTLYKEIGQYEQSLEMLNQIIDNPYNYPVESLLLAYATKADILAKKGEFDVAYEHCDTALEYIPYLAGSPLFSFQVAAIHQVIGRVALEEGEYEKSLRSFATSLKWCSNDERVYSLQGKLYARMGIFDKALEKHKEAIQFNTVLHLCYYNLSCYYALKNEVEQSLVYLEKALEKGFKDFSSIAIDPDLERIRETPELAKLLQKYPPLRLNLKMPSIKK